MKLYHSTAVQKVQDGLSSMSVFRPEYIHVFTYRVLKPQIPSDNPLFVLVSSKRAVEWLVHESSVSSRLQNIPFYVVGEASRFVLIKNNFKIQGFVESGVRELLPCLPMDGGWFIGAKHPVQCTQNWIQSSSVVHISCYEQVPQSLTMINFDIDAVYLLTSPNIVRRYHEMGMEQSSQIVVLGQSSLEMARELGYVNVSRSPYANITRTVEWLESQ